MRKQYLHFLEALDLQFLLPQRIPDFGSGIGTVLAVLITVKFDLKLKTPIGLQFHVALLEIVAMLGQIVWLTFQNMLIL